jgi:hypothetical protein
MVCLGYRIFLIDLGLEIRLKLVWASRFFWAKSCPLPMCGSDLYSIPKRDNNDLAKKKT